MEPKSRRTTPNKSRRTVRRHAERVARSQWALRRAMAELLRERAFDAITVRELLARAGIGRATFYAHFQDKDDLLFASYCGMLDTMTERLRADPPGARRLLPVREFFAHVGEAHGVLKMLEDSGKLPALWDLAGAHFARAVEPAVGSPVTARFLAGALLELLKWWLTISPRPPAEQLDAQFHGLARRVLAAR